MSFLSITKTFQRIIHRRGSTSAATPLTKPPLYGVCRVKTSNFFFIGIRLKTWQRIIHRRGSTRAAPPLTKPPLYGVCRVKISKCFFIGIRLKTCIMDIYMSRYVLSNIYMLKVASDTIFMEQVMNLSEI